MGFLGLIEESLVKSLKLNYCSGNFTLGEKCKEIHPKCCHFLNIVNADKTCHNQILNPGSHRKACNIHTKFHLTSNAFLACFLHKVLKTDQPTKPDINLPGAFSSFILNCDVFIVQWIMWK